jgi:hypothetical protein
MGVRSKSPASDGIIKKRASKSPARISKINKAIDNNSDSNINTLSRTGKKYKDLPFPEIYFGGCCWGAAFYIGVYRALWELYGPDMVSKGGLKVSGDSAGCVIALMIAGGYHPDKLDAIYRKVGEKSKETQPWYNPFNNTGSSVYCEDVLRNEILINKNDYQKFNHGNFTCGTTAFYDKHYWHMNWSSNEDLINTIKGCYHIPFYCHSIEPVYGVNCVDGAYGISGQDFLNGDYTLFIGIDPHAEITRTFTNAEMFYPAIGQEYDDMVTSGYHAMMNWDGKFLKKVGQMCSDAPGTQYALPMTYDWKLKRIVINKNSIENDKKLIKKYNQYWKPYRVANHPMLAVLWVMRVIELYFKYFVLCGIFFTYFVLKYSSFI